MYVCVILIPVNIIVTSTEQKYILADLGSECDRIGLPYLVSEGDCQEAANHLGMEYARAVDHTNAPMGCYENTRNLPRRALFFNRGTGASADSLQRSICLNGK